MENMILEENVEKAIEAALAEPGDFEYAIDKEVNWVNHNCLHCDHHIVLIILIPVLAIIVIPIISTNKFFTIIVCIIFLVTMSCIVYH